jgi:putative tryptophan/tyrosine transport system substrate-binding protein
MGGVPEEPAPCYGWLSRREDLMPIGGANRRAFIAGLGSAAAWPLVGRAQQAGQVYRVAWASASAPISELTENSSMHAVGAFFLELRALGYVEGQNLIFDRFSGGGQLERYGEVARDVVARKPDVIVTIGHAMLRHLQSASSTIPIIAMMADPISAGLTTSLARPSGSVTGVSIDAGTEIWGKRLALLKEIVPTLSRACFLGSKRMWENLGLMAPLQNAAKQLEISLSGCLLEGPVREAEYRRVFAAMPRDRLDAIVTSSEPEQFINRTTIVELAETAKLPAVYPAREYAELGGLIFYGSDLTSLYRLIARIVPASLMLSSSVIVRAAARDVSASTARTATFVDKILKGAKLANLPIEQPTNQLVIKVKTAIRWASRTHNRCCCELTK